MNLEGGGNGLCGNTFGQYNQIDCSNGGDYVEVFDGRDADAPSLSGHLTGDVTDGTKQFTELESVLVSLLIPTHLCLPVRPHCTRHIHKHWPGPVRSLRHRCGELRPNGNHQRPGLLDGMAVHRGWR